MSDPTAGNALLVATPLTPQATQAMVCKDMLSPERLQQARQIAAQEYPRMLQNTLVYANFGNDAVAAMNDLVSRVLDTVSRDELRAFEPVIKNLSKKLDSIARNYDVSDPKVLAKYEQSRGGFLSFFRGVRSFWKALERDIKSLQTQLEDARDELAERRELLSQNVATYDILYQQNRTDIQNLIFVIAAMELIRDIALEDAKNVVISDNDSFGDGGDEERARRTELANNLDNRITDFKSRLYMAQRGGPQTRLVRSVDVASIGKNDAMTTHAVPLIQTFMIEMATLQRSRDAARVNDAVRNTLNTVIQQYAGAASVMIPEIMQSNNTTLLAAASVDALTTGFKATVDGMLKAIEAGIQERQKLNLTMTASAETMKAESIRLSDRTIELMEAAGQPEEITLQVLQENKILLPAS